MANIMIASGRQCGDRFPLGRRTNVIGRAESLPIQILDDRVSRKHLQIRFDPATGCHLAFDMGSKNGVFINGVKTTGETRLRDRDSIRVGETLLLFAEKDGDDSTAMWHRFKKPGECLRPTQLDLQSDRPRAPPSHVVAFGRDRQGFLVVF